MRRIPQGAVEALLFLREAEGGVGARRRGASSRQLVQASMVTWNAWMQLRHWLVDRGLVKVVDGPERGRIVQQAFTLTERGRLVAEDLSRAVDRAYGGEPRPVRASRKEPE